MAGQAIVKCRPNLSDGCDCTGMCGGGHFEVVLDMLECNRDAVTLLANLTCGLQRSPSCVERTWVGPGLRPYGWESADFVMHGCGL